MSQLQKLLNKRWPLTANLSTNMQEKRETMRNVFAEGYHTAIQDMIKAFPEIPDIGRIGKELTTKKTNNI